MSEGEFKVIKETEYGPQIVRAGSVADPDRNRTKEHPGFVEDEGRRNAVFGLAALGGASALVGAGALLRGKNETEDNRSSSGKIGGSLDADGEVDTGERVDTAVEHEGTERSFENELQGYKALFQLHKDEVVFVDKNNVPVGNPIKMKDVVAPKFHKDGRLAMREYLYSAGPKNDIDIPKEGIAGEWLDLVRDGLAYTYPNREVVRVLHAVPDFNAALANTREPELVAGLQSGEIDDYKGIVEYFADKPMEDSEGLSRIEYIQKHIQFSDTVPPVVQAELRRVLPGLCAQESKFNNGVVSSVGARGIFQIMPTTWEYYDGTDTDLQSLARQVEIVGRYLSDLYDEVQRAIGPTAMRFLERKFGGKDALDVELMVPLMLTSYNAGSSRVAEAVVGYIRNADIDSMPDGKDLFVAIADYGVKSKRGRLGGYGKHSREYVTRIYAQAEVLQEGT